MLPAAVAGPDRATILNTLQAMCASRLPVALMSRDLLSVCHGNFVELADEFVVLEFPTRPTGLAFSPPAFCIATFNQEQRPHLFTTRIKHNPEDGQPPRVAIEIPSVVRWPESRMAVRLPVPAGAPLQVWLRTETNRHTAVGRDISLCGALVELVDPQPPVLEAGQRIVVDATLGNQSITLPAIVRRRAPPLYGLYFPDSVKEGRLDPPAALRHLVDALAQYG